MTPMEGMPSESWPECTCRSLALPQQRGMPCRKKESNKRAWFFPMGRSTRHTRPCAPEAVFPNRLTAPPVASTVLQRQWSLLRTLIGCVDSLRPVVDGGERLVCEALAGGHTRSAGSVRGEIDAIDAVCLRQGQHARDIVI